MEDLYYVYGIEGVSKLKSSSIFIYCLDDEISVEISKHLKLNGIQNIFISDEIELTFTHDSDIFIIINQSIENIEKTSNYCRLNNKKLIVLWTKDIGGLIFVDANKHLILNKSYYDVDPVQIGQIFNNGKVECAPYNLHNFKDGDIITFTNLIGDNLDLLQKEWKIKSIDKNSFELENFDLINFNFVNGTALIINKSFEIEHQSFIDYLNNSTDDIIKNYIETYYPNLKQITPIVSIFGSLVASETIKLVTNKCIPISQSFFWSDETLNYNQELELKLKESTWLLVGKYFYEDFKHLNITVIDEKINLDKLDFKVSGIINTIDITRRHMDEECFKHNIPLFDAKIKKMSGFICPVIPFVTDTYFSSNEVEQEQSFPLCVIKSFPNNIKHIIEWALQEYETINLLFKDIKLLNENEKNKIDKYIHLYTEKQYENLAVYIFNDYFYIAINNLIECSQKGVTFWSKGKRCPKPIQYDSENKYHNEFIEITKKLLNHNEEQIYNYENELHVKWINSMSNIRALNYGIPIINYLETKWLTAKSYPNISTTLSCTSGLILLEIMKYLNKELNNNFKTNIIDLIDSTIISSSPSIAKMTEIGGVLINNWTKFEYNKNTTLNEFKKYYENIFETIITIIVIDTTMIFADFIESDVLYKNLSDILLNHFKTDILPKNINFNLLSNDDKEIPIIKINLI
jgi:hypothetical protein